MDWMQANKNILYFVHRDIFNTVSLCRMSRTRKKTPNTWRRKYMNHQKHGDFNKLWQWAGPHTITLSKPSSQYFNFNRIYWLSTGFNKWLFWTIMKVTKKMQIYRLIYYSKSALHVSGDVFAHHQKHLSVFTVSGSVHPSCCRLVSWMSWNSSKTPAGSNLGKQYQIL
jgi:hypothetical protein